MMAAITLTWIRPLVNTFSLRSSSLSAASRDALYFTDNLGIRSASQSSWADRQRILPGRNGVLKNSFRAYAEQAQGTKKRRWPWVLLGIVAGGYVLAKTGKYFGKSRIKSTVDKSGGKFVSVPGLRDNLIVEYKGVRLPALMMMGMEEIDKMEVREDDIFVISFPQSGSTWAQEVAYLVSTGAVGNEASYKNIHRHYRFLEMVFPRGPRSWRKQEDTDSPRFLESHLPYSLLPAGITNKKPKIIYVVRNPRDTAVSYYTFYHLMPFIRYDGKFEAFLKSFLDDQLGYSPWGKHVKEFWDRRNDDNILFLQYEDMRKDMDGAIKRIATFLGKELTADQMASIKSSCHFDRMRWSDSNTYRWHKEDGEESSGKEHWWKKGEPWFLMKGKAGQWKDHFTEQMVEDMDKYVQDSLGSTQLKFEYDQV